MKKDREWLKDEINKVIGTASYKGLFYSPLMSRIFYDDLIKVVEQLDEPEQVVCAENERTTVVSSKKETITPTVSKKEIVEVPQFVDKWFKKRKKDFESAYKAMLYINAYGWDDETHIEYKLYKWIPENVIAFCKAWDYGYTIEQPKLLTVIVKDYDKTIMTKQMPEDGVNKMMEGLK